MKSEFNILDTELGKSSASPEKYSPELLFRIPRSENREQYQIMESGLPFVGVDVWNCYELSFLTDNGLPVSAMMKLIYPAESTYLVESKSLKLYLNSFNMECCGKTVTDALKNVEIIIQADLTQLLQTDVIVCFFRENSAAITPFPEFMGKDLCQLIPSEVIETYKFDHFFETPDLLKGRKSDQLNEYIFSTNLLRSNCRVTNQPDWGDLFVHISGAYEIDLVSVVAYLVSFRKENHFHEEVVEMIYKRLWDKFNPEKLMVAAMYTRRGGIDINPIRASHKSMIDSAFLSTDSRLEKTLRQ